GGPRDAFVTRLRADGRALVYSTYLGGSGDENRLGGAIAVDPATGDAIVTGETRSTDFPTVNGLQPNLRGDADAFVARLRSDGAALVYGTYLGGGNEDRGWGVAADPATGDALITGDVLSTDFPTANALQPTSGGQADAFVTRIGSSPVAYYYVYP